MQDILAAYSDPFRRAALALPWDGGEHCVCGLSDRFGPGQSRMSRYMKVLRAAGSVVDRRDAQWVRYCRDPALAPKLAELIDKVLVADRTPERTRI